MQSIQCLMCKHFDGDMKCEAFPKEIPQEIFNGEYDHSKPYPGDNGIRFEEITEKTPSVPARG